jgi:hypothetical protein
VSGHGPRGHRGSGSRALLCSLLGVSAEAEAAGAWEPSAEHRVHPHPKRRCACHRDRTQARARRRVYKSMADTHVPQKLTRLNFRPIRYRSKCPCSNRTSLNRLMAGLVYGT